MKKLIVFLCVLSIPYFVGRFQYCNACSVIENLTDKTDGEIEDVLSVFNYDIDCFTTPSFSDHYKAGLRSWTLIYQL